MFELEYDRADEMTLNMGPQHPSTHGVIRFVLKTDGEVMRKAIPDVGYLHRGIEGIGELVTYPGYMPYTDRVDYLAAMFTNWCWALAVEKLTGIEVPPRGDYCRVVSSELNRMASHLLAVGAFAMDVGAVTPFPYALREREAINDLIEELCGARLTYNYHRIGGVAWDFPRGWRDKVLTYLDHLEVTMDEYDRLITGNAIFRKRLANVAVIPPAEAIAYGFVGPNLRASGVDFDLRRDEPYSMYSKLDFEVPVAKGEVGSVGDCYERFVVRLFEIRESIKIVRQCFDQMEPGEVWSKPGKKIRKVKPGEAHARIESARGDLLCYVVADGSMNCYRSRWRTGSFNAMTIIEHKSYGMMVADLVALIASLDIVAPEIDR